MNIDKSFAFSKSGLMPQEETLALKKEQSSITIGIPREHTFQENRVSLCPEGVQQITDSGHKVLIERGAGVASGFRDNEYSEAGAKIVEDPAEVYQSDIILKIAPLTINEIDSIGQGKIIISAIHATNQSPEYFNKMMKKKLIAFGYEYIKDNTGNLPVLRAISEISGYTSIQIAAEYLCRLDFGKGVMLGNVAGITPTEVVIIGAGTVGEYAARAALAFGAVVKIFDNKLYKLRKIQNSLGNKVFTSIIHSGIIQKALKNADVLIGCLYSEAGRSPIVVTEEMVLQMKKGAVIIDVSIDQGGCVETSIVTNHNNPVFQFNGITHYCVPNIPSRVPRTASYALNNFFVPKIIELGKAGTMQNFLYNNESFRRGAYMFNGILTNSNIANLYSLPCQNIDLLIAAFSK